MNADADNIDYRNDEFDSGQLETTSTYIVDIQPISVFCTKVCTHADDKK